MFYGSITGNEWNTTADNQPFTVRQSFPTVFTLSDPYRNLPGGVGPFPFNYNPASPRFTLPAQVFGPSLDFVWPLHLPDERDDREGDRPQLQRERVVRRRARPEPAGEHRQQLSGLRPGRDRGERQHAAAVSAGHRSAPARVLESIFASDYHGLQLSAERRGTRFSAKAYYSFGRGYEDVDYQGGGLPAVQNSNRLDLRARPRRRPTARTASRSPASGRSTTSRTSTPVVRRLAQRLDGLGDRHAAERHAAHDRRRAGSQLRRPHQRSRRPRSAIPKLDGGRAARRADRGLVQRRRLRAPGARHRRQLGPQHRRRPGLSQRRPGHLPRHPPDRAARCCSSASRPRTSSTS